MKLEEKLRKAMILKGFNQQKLARASRVSDSEVSRILGGKSQPGLENALRLARAVGVSLDYLADDAIEEDTTRATAVEQAEERELLELARELGPRQARRILESASVLGYEVAIRRLHGAEMKPVIEVAEAPH
ncbi:MAG: helix-turn-helix transcriptional regulator, partial [Isosphaeraceae bacterium]|nr:helix-turn-helix transcriptional regulator [Isosphaeraceae bacterium]